ncbi:hypothetical protein CC86DRAFT_151393 [Ophiobolus disseminans]|uniref:Secreted protein n=1 Tax=Ophiobolus disseminans TaxID=1469910 RepID=A0A6A6ZCK5_9PLEO|nr:hypothetical protein CC86DRAFT_151393 [Ophiobolus disseminans]
MQKRACHVFLLVTGAIGEGGASKVPKQHRNRDVEKIIARSSLRPTPHLLAIGSQPPAAMDHASDSRPTSQSPCGQPAIPHCATEAPSDRCSGYRLARRLRCSHRFPRALHVVSSRPTHASV